MKPAFLFLVATLAAPLLARAAEFPATSLLAIGFREARLADFGETPQFKARSGDPSGLLAVTADFNGDGKPDEARLLLNDAQQIAYIVVTIQTPEKLDTYVLDTYPLTAVSAVGISAVAPAPSAHPDAKYAGLRIFNIDTGQGESAYFDGEEFSIVAK